MIDSIWIIGAIVLALIVVQMLVALVGSLRRSSCERERLGLEIQLFEHRVAAARALRTQREAKAAAWAGYRKFQVQRKVDEGGDICSFYLEPHDSKRDPLVVPAALTIGRLIRI